MYSDRHYSNIILEDINGKFNAMLEIMSQFGKDLADTARQTDLDEVKADIKVVKAAVTDTNHLVADHEKRITRLESAHS